ncbi:MAG: class I SAM-dependent rRNA methyltransferase [Trueperaceae bacterium]|nr:class I SAM-dependent rRNA methyltransferase [Trueperaceae bacterium]
MSAASGDGLATIRLPPELEGVLASGHPWVYRDHLPERGRGLESGSWVRVEAGRAAAVGLADADGAIAVRLYRHARTGGPLARPDRAWLRDAVEAAVALRSPIAASGDDAYRLLYGEGDGLPGITADRYGRWAVIRTYAPSLRPDAGTAAAEVLATVAEAIGKAADLRGVLLADDTAAEEASTPHVLWGTAPPPRLTVRDGGRSMLVEFGVGQKTGLFLDQRENRRVVQAHAEGRSVLDLFSYTGAFSVAALAGGARTVTSVDVSAGALAAAERNVALLPGDAATRHRSHRADLMQGTPDALDGALRAHGEIADLVVLDPPSLARNKSQRHAAIRSFRRLNAAVLARLPEGGLLATASCTAQVSVDDFRGALAAAAQDAGVRARVLHEAGHPLDHPVPLHFPEGRYLTFVLLQVSRRG